MAAVCSSGVPCYWRAALPFEEFAREYTAGLLRTAYLLTGKQEDAEDLVQDTLVKVHVQWKRIAASHNSTA